MNVGGLAGRARPTRSPPQGSGELLTGFWNDEQDGHVHGQRDREAVEQVDARVVFPALDLADHAGVGGGIDGELLLRRAELAPDASEVPGNSLAGVHGGTAQPWRALHHWL